ncbi:hypothetical protein OQA88_7503 [Cercophora sp. LCS_1]
MGLMDKFMDIVHKIRGDDERKVFAHYMVGLTCNQSPQQWYHDMVTAKAVGIDGFALNIGPEDPWTEKQLQEAYRAAEYVGDFVLFLSFDMACGDWPVAQVVDLINTFKDSKAQMNAEGKPFVSTFEGPGWADNWSTVRDETGGIFLVPDWASLGPYGVGEKLDVIDGAFSWDAWPKPGVHRMTATEDHLYKEVLQGKKYMMPVSPCFYTNLPQWDKNWYSSSESLWFDRWQQVLEVMPDYVEIITWNDYGESHYICDTCPPQIVPGAEKYVNGYSHSALRAILPYFIAAYKAGTPDIEPPGEDTAVAWYRTTPARTGADGGTQWGQSGSESAATGARDVISIVAITKTSASVTVAIGGYYWNFATKPNSPVSYFELPFDGRITGPVRLTLNGRTAEGPPIVNECCHGHVIFNHASIAVYRSGQRTVLFAAANGALATAAFVQLSEKENAGPEDTGEKRMLQVSREEIKKKVDEDYRGLRRARHQIVLFLDLYIWEPICTGVRFLELVVIFVPVMLTVPVIWVGRRRADRDGERTGTLWWYHFLVKAMEWAGPAFIKLGQWAASRTDIFPTELCEIMSKLHADAPAHSLYATKKTVRHAFNGREFHEIFDEFDEKPLGVGAIAQVYRARLKPGLAAPEEDEEMDTYSDLRHNVQKGVKSVLKSSPKHVPSSYVAVKVLHPGVERTVRRDLRIMHFFASILNYIPTIEWLSLPDEVEQFGDMMKLQLDLRIEAANLAMFRDNFRERTTASFPYPYTDFTTRNVLVEEFAHGIPLADFIANGGGVFQKDIASEGLDAFLRMVLIDNFVHADLHPGNIMVRFYKSDRPNIRLGRRHTEVDPDNHADATEEVLSRLTPFRKDKERWNAELTKIDREGFRPQLIFIDTGLVTELNETNRRNFLDLFRAVAEFDGYKAGHLMCERCRQPEAVLDKEVFALKMQHLVLSVKSRTLALGNIKIGDILQQVLSMVRQHHVRLEGDFVNVVISILLLEGIGRTLNPDVDLLSSSLPILRQLGAQSGKDMVNEGDFSMLMVWVGLEARRFMQASIEDVERCVKYDLLSPNV